MYSNTGVRDFCLDEDVYRDEFDYPVVIAVSVTNCDNMFEGCASYNQPTVIPSSAVDCTCMFWDCEALDQTIIVPDSVVAHRDMFKNCKKMQHHLAEGKTTNFFN